MREIQGRFRRSNRGLLFLVALVAIWMPLKAQDGSSNRLAGKWEWKGEIGWQRLTLDLKEDRGKLTGTIKMGPGPGLSTSPEDYWEYFFVPGVFEITNGTIRGDAISFDQIAVTIHKQSSYQDGGKFPEIKLTYSGRLEGERLYLVRELRDPLAHLNVQNQRFEIVMTRTGATPSPVRPIAAEPRANTTPIPAMIDVRVQDSSGRFVTSLRKEDFQVSEGGVSREILSVATPDTPLNIVFLFDMDALLLTAQAYSGDPAYAARGEEHSKETLQVLGNGIATFYRSLRSQDRFIIDCFLDDRTAQMLPWRNGGQKGEWAASQPNFEYRPVAKKDLYRAIRNALERLRGAKGRSMVVLVTDGRDGRLNGTLFRTKQRLSLVDPFYGLPNIAELREFDQVLEAVQKSSVQFFIASVNGDRPYDEGSSANSVWGSTSMQYVPGAELDFPRLHQVDNDRLNRLARLSGGAIISHRKPQEAGSAIARLGEWLSPGRTYRIAHVSSVTKSTGRDVKVSVRNPQLRIESLDSERLWDLQ